MSILEAPHGKAVALEVVAGIQKAAAVVQGAEVRPRRIVLRRLPIVGTKATREAVPRTAKARGDRREAGAITIIIISSIPTV